MGVCFLFKKWKMFSFVKKWTFPQHTVHYVQYQYFTFYLCGGCICTQCTPCLWVCTRNQQVIFSTAIMCHKMHSEHVMNNSTKHV